MSNPDVYPAPEYIPRHVDFITSIRHSKEYKIWRKAILKRDRYRCQRCSNRHHLDVHHRIPLMEIIIMRRSELLWDINNGQTLCKKCDSIEERKH